MRTILFITTMLFALASSAQSDSLKFVNQYGNQAPPSLYEVGKIGDNRKAPRFWPLRIIRENPRKAARFYDIVGFTTLTAGAVLRGSAEHWRMHNGTTGDFDRFHIERDAGLLLTGVGCAALGTATACNVLDWDKNSWAVIINRAVFGLVVSRLAAECTYMAK